MKTDKAKEWINIRHLRLQTYTYYGINKICNVLKNTSDSINKVYYYPIIRSQEQLGDIVNRISWYLPDSVHSDIIVYVPVEKN